MLPKGFDPSRTHDALDPGCPAGVGAPRALFIGIGVVLLAEFLIRLLPLEATVGVDEFDFTRYAATRQILRERGSTEGFIIGSSRSRDGLIAPEIAAALAPFPDAPRTWANYANPAGSAEVMEVLTDIILESPGQKRLMIYGLSPFQFNGHEPRLQYLYMLMDFPRWRRSIPVYGWRAALPHLPLIARNECENRIRLVSANGRPMDWFGETARGFPRSLQLTGGIGEHHTLEPDRSTLLESTTTTQNIRNFAAVWAPDGEYPVSEDKIQAAIRLINKVRAAGIEVILVELPLSAYMWQAYPPTLRDEFSAIMRRIESETSLHIHTVDELDISPPVNEFYDLVHTNYLGGLRITGNLIERVILPEWTARAAAAGPPPASPDVGVPSDAP